MLPPIGALDVKLGNMIDKKMPTQLLATKAQRPCRPPGLIDRPRLLAALNHALNRRLTIIKGAAGFGKTSIALAWAETLQSQGHIVAWFSLDTEDDEPTQFLFNIAHVLGTACGDLGNTVIDLIDEVALVRPQTIVHALINNLADVDGEVFLFLDDYHVLTHPSVHDSIVYLLRYAPSNLHLVLITRTEPDLPLGRWRAQNELLEVTGSTLRFDLEETRTFLSQEIGGPLEPTEITTLHAKTEGWPAILRIVATTSAHSGLDFAQYVRNLSSKARPIRSYIAEMLGGLPETITGFLLRVAILDRLCAPLCQVVSGFGASQELLENAATHRLLFIPLDQNGIWFRCHPLLRSFLMHKLESELPEEIPELHRRAYAWYAGAEMWTDAIQHAIAVGDTEQTIGWIENCAMTLLKRGELMTLLTWARLMPVVLMKRQVKVRLAIAWGMALATRFDEALQMATDIEEELGAAEPETVEALGCECLTIRAVALSLRDDTAGALVLAEESLRRNSSGRWTSNAAANVALAGYWKQSNLANCYAVPWISFSDNDSRHNVIATVYRLCLQGLVEYQQLRTSSAARYFNEALRVAEDHAGPNSVAAAMPASFMAQLLYDQGRLNEAETIVIDRLAVIEAAGMLECVLSAYLVLIRVAEHRGNNERAYTLLDQAEALGNVRQWGRLSAAAAFEKIRLNLRERRDVQANVGVAQLNQLASAYHAPTRCAWSEIHDYAALAQAEWLSAQKSHPESIAILRRMVLDAKARQQPDAILRLTIRLAVELCHHHDTSTALALLGETMPAAASAGMVQPFHDAGGEIISILPRLQDNMRRQCAPNDILHFMATLLGHQYTAQRTSPIPARGAENAEPLSPRERDVLSLLVKGRPNKDIAKALRIAPETVKSHLKNIFLKLAVSNRAQAVSRALSLGLANSSFSGNAPSPSKRR
jgi:LuxR family maltose regulon positive regulatory protein